MYIALQENENAEPFPSALMGRDVISDPRSRVEKPVEAGEARYIQLLGKRTMDIVLSAAALLVLAPVLVVIAIAICLESKGSPLFSQIRIPRSAIS